MVELLMASSLFTTGSRGLRTALYSALGLLMLVALATGVQASINTGASALDIAESIESVPDSVVDAEWIERPLNGTPSAVATTLLADFPINGESYAILSNGDASAADEPDPKHQASSDNSGLPVRGQSDKDVLVLRIGINACANGVLSFDYRFFSEEYPRWTDAHFNDTFVAELDGTSWTTSKDGTTAPHAFVIEAVNTAAFTPGAAAGTPYGGATMVHTASTSITAGAHDLYLSIYDMGRATFDSAVFVDNLQFPTNCVDPCEGSSEPECCESDCVDPCEGSSEPECCESDCEPDCPSLLDPCANPCSNPAAVGTSFDSMPFPVPTAVIVGLEATSSCGPCPAWPQTTATSETDILAPTSSGDVDVDTCKPVPCSAGDPLHAAYEADQNGPWVGVWLGTTYVGSVGVTVPDVTLHLVTDLSTDAADCVPST